MRNGRANSPTARAHGFGGRKIDVTGAGGGEWPRSRLQQPILAVRAWRSARRQAGIGGLDRGAATHLASCISDRTLRVSHASCAASVAKKGVEGPLERRAVGVSDGPHI